MLCVTRQEIVSIIKEPALHTSIGLFPQVTEWAQGSLDYLHRSTDITDERSLQPWPYAPPCRDEAGCFLHVKYLKEILRPSIFFPYATQ
jgi:hypothetical protein